jgi:hypothetical protein
MPVPKKKPTTSVPQDSMPEPSSPVLPNQEEFGQHVRRLAVSAVQEMTRTSHARRTGTVHRSFLGGNALPIAVGIAMVPTLAIW